MEISVRLMQESDLNTLARIYCEVYRVFDVGEQWDEASAYKLLDYWLHKQPDLAFVAEVDAKPVGAFIAGIKPWWDGNHLVDGELFVQPEYQSKGVGTQLSRTMFQTAVEKYQATVWDTYTFAKYDFPLTWYKSLGFEPNEDWLMISGDLKQALKRIELRSN